MNSLPKISIITPSYNQAAFLKETIQSVLEQKYPNLEYIIIDGGSSDGSVEIIRKYEQDLAYWVSERDAGQTDAINKGFARATGEICAWLNSDDTYFPNTLFDVAQQFQAHPAAAMIYGNVDFVDASGKFLSRFVIQPFRLPQMLYDHLIPQPAAFVRRAALEHAGGLNSDLKFCMDYDLWLRVARAEEVHYAPRVWATYRVHASSKSSNLQALRWSETATILTNLFARADVPRTWRAYQADAIGRAHWHAAVEYARAKEDAHAREHIHRALEYAPRELGSRDLAGFLVGSVAAQTNNETLACVEHFFELVPESARGKRDGLRLARARIDALRALNEETPADVARRHARNALRADVSWVRNRHVVRRALL